MNLALIRFAGGQVPAWFADADAPSLLKAVAMTAEADRETRLAAARRAAQWGALSPVELAGIVGGMGISADEVAAVLLEPENASAGLRLAVMYLAANDQDIAVARAEILREMWRLATLQQDWRLAARLTAPQLREVRPSPTFSWFAGDAIAASLAAGNTEQALNWFQSAASRGAADPGAAAAITAMWPALRIAAGPGAAPASGGIQGTGLRSVRPPPGHRNIWRDQPSHSTQRPLPLGRSPISGMDRLAGGGDAERCRHHCHSVGIVRCVGRTSFRSFLAASGIGGTGQYGVSTA